MEKSGFLVCLKGTPRHTSVALLPLCQGIAGATTGDIWLNQRIRLLEYLVQLV